MTKKRVFFGITGLVVAAITVCINGLKVQRYKTNRIDAYVRYTCKHLLNPHAGPENVMRIDGRTHRNVAGEPPFVLQCSNRDLILFVTDEGSGQSTLHFYDLKSRVEIEIAGRSYFGDNIGLSGVDQRDFCEFLNLREALISSRRGGRQD